MFRVVTCAFLFAKPSDAALILHHAYCCSNTNLAKQHAHCGNFGTLPSSGKARDHMRVRKRSAIAWFKNAIFLASLQETLMGAQAV